MTQYSNQFNLDESCPNYIELWFKVSKAIEDSSDSEEEEEKTVAMKMAKSKSRFGGGRPSRVK